ncbi:MAG: DUF4352 domain-containing protein [Actinomycetota bacterium]
MAERMNQQHLSSPIPEPPSAPQKKRWPYVLLGIFVGVVAIVFAISIILLTVVGKGAKEGVEKAKEEGLVDTEVHEGAVGTPVKCGKNLEVVVHGVEEVTPDPYWDSAEDVYYLALDISFENHGKEVEPISSLMEMKLKDREGRVYEPAIFDAKEPGLPEGDIPPGSKARGYVTFKVTKGAEGLSFEFNPLLGDGALVHLVD